MCWRQSGQDKGCETEHNALVQLMVMLQRSTNNLVLFPFADKSIGTLMYSLSRLDGSPFLKGVQKKRLQMKRHYQKYNLEVRMEFFSLKFLFIIYMNDL